MVRDGQVLGLGSGRAAAALVRALSARVRAEGLAVTCVPTSLQIKLVAESGGLRLVEADQVAEIDVAFDGADQIDRDGNMVKGGGGALLREGIVIGAARKVVIMAGAQKFSERLDVPVPLEVHPLARATASKAVSEAGGRPALRLLDRGYPFVTENGNVILDCDFGEVGDPRSLRRDLTGIAGALEAGIFTRAPDVAYRDEGGGRFGVIRR